MTTKKIILSVAVGCALAYAMPATAQTQEPVKPGSAKTSASPVSPNGVTTKPVTAKPQANKPEPCKTPTNLKVMPAENGFTAKWDAVEGAKGYQVFVHDVDGKHGSNGYKAETNTFSAKNLAAGTDYEVKVSTRGCATSPNMSKASAPAKVKTPGKAPMPEPVGKKPAPSTR